VICVLLLCIHEASWYHTKLQTIKLAERFYRPTLFGNYRAHKSWPTLSTVWHCLYHCCGLTVCNVPIPTVLPDPTRYHMQGHILVQNFPHYCSKYYGKTMVTATVSLSCFKWNILFPVHCSWRTVAIAGITYSEVNSSYSGRYMLNHCVFTDPNSIICAVLHWSKFYFQCIHSVKLMQLMPAIPLQIKLKNTVCEWLLYRSAASTRISSCMQLMLNPWLNVQNIQHTGQFTSGTRTIHKLLELTIDNMLQSVFTEGGGLAQLVTSSVASKKLINAGPG